MRKLFVWASIIIVFVVVIWAAAEGRQWLFRHRAQRLLAEIKALDLNRSTWSDAQGLMHRWGRWGQWYGDCNAQNCQYTVNMDDQLPDAPQFVYEDGLHVIARLLDHVGLRSSEASASFNVTHGVVTNKSFRMDVGLPFRDWGVPNGTYWPLLEAQVSEAATLRYDNPHYRASRPNHAFVQRRILRDASFTPEESLEEQTALMDFHLDCVTHWSPCRSRAELLPRAEEEFQAETDYWRRQERDGKETEDNNRFTPTCFPTVQIRAREEHDVLVGDVVRASVVQAPADDNPDHTVWMIDVRLVKLLKGKAPGPVGSIISVFEPSKVDSAPVDGPWSLQNVLITGMTAEGWKTNALVVYSGDCGTVEASPANLAAARRGVNDDFGPRY